jgi:hypothetical protein
LNYSHKSWICLATQHARALCQQALHSWGRHRVQAWGSGCGHPRGRLPDRKEGRPAAGHTQELPAATAGAQAAVPAPQAKINRMGQPYRKEAYREGHRCRQKQGQGVEGGRKSCLGCWAGATPTDSGQAVTGGHLVPIFPHLHRYYYHHYFCCWLAWALGIPEATIKWCL